ncbi:GerMN domain-containing protein [Paenibacillus wynnii]|uniref:GerMN domain-containing protein n=1 Tax=Paenibacillus wynnii TaxID=268407 RepID=UPI0027905B22|nr:GerMN domain-containing protein [Paenibacillus wynnii]MDQ0194645.1 germination protein M [Paenibacillus wynnii]
MTHMQKIRGISAACLLAVPLALSGCSLLGMDASSSVDPPPTEVEAQMLEISGDTLDSGVLGPVTLDANTLEASAPAAADNSSTAPRTTVYLEDGNGLLAPVSLSLPSGEGATTLKDALTALVSKGAYEALLPTGFHGMLPAGTTVQNVTVDKEKGLAVVEFNAKFNDYAVQDERKILEAITWTLTGEEGIKGVQLWVDGKKLNEMPLNGTPLDRPLSRTLGINLPKSNTLDMNSSAVTVYFSAASPEGVQYYVPMTRFVPAGQEPVKAALGELLSGPESGDGVETVMTAGTIIDSVEEGQNGVVTVSLKDDMFVDGDKVPAEMLQSVVLTVAQNSEDSLVQIRLNGKDAVTGTNEVDYGKPVSAPQYLNELPL